MSAHSISFIMLLLRSRRWAIANGFYFRHRKTATATRSACLARANLSQTHFRPHHTIFSVFAQSCTFIERSLFVRIALTTYIDYVYVYAPHHIHSTHTHNTHNKKNTRRQCVYMFPAAHADPGPLDLVCTQQNGNRCSLLLCRLGAPTSAAVSNSARAARE